jgi:hypothetical protein
LPWTHGDTAIEPAASDVLVPVAVPPIELPARPAGRIDRAIADHVARLIPDRATIELGLGAIPEAVTRALRQRSTPAAPATASGRDPHVQSWALYCGRIRSFRNRNPPMAPKC